jgi:hypothetical protein
MIIKSSVDVSLNPALAVLPAQDELDMAELLTEQSSQ